MSIDNVTRAADIKRSREIISSFLDANGDPGIGFVRKFMAEQKLTLHDLCPRLYGPAQQELVDDNSSPMVGTIDRVFGTLAIQNIPNPTPLAQQPTGIVDIPLDSMDF